jgi:hypothetical protein
MDRLYFPRRGGLSEREADREKEREREREGREQTLFCEGRVSV